MDGKSGAAQMAPGWGHWFWQAANRFDFSMASRAPSDGAATQTPAKRATLGPDRVPQVSAERTRSTQSPFLAGTGRD